MSARVKLLEGNLAAQRARLVSAADKDSLRRQIRETERLLADARLTAVPLHTVDQLRAERLTELLAAERIASWRHESGLGGRWVVAVRPGDEPWRFSGTEVDAFYAGTQA